MTETNIQQIYEDLEYIKKDIAIIKNILIEEQELTEEAKKRLKISRNAPLSEYVEL